MAGNMRRLQRDHSALHKSLPPYFFFPPTGTSSDLSTLEIYLVGPPSTPYSSGLFKLLLRIPETYHSSPPSALFRTKIFHPNVDESTGSVCVDTLKRDWTPSLTLRDILITISCLLIYPNPDSALNAHAGQLIQDDFEEFKRYASMMTGIHARIPSELESLAAQARTRGESIAAVRSEVMDRDMLDTPSTVSSNSTSSSNASVEAKEGREVDPSDSDEEDSQKENTPPQDLILQHPVPIPIRRPLLGKRPLSDLPPPIDPDDLLSDSQRNISANSNRSLPLPRDSPQLSGALRSPNLSTPMLRMGLSQSRASSRSNLSVSSKEGPRATTLVERIRGGNIGVDEGVCKKRRGEMGKENEEEERMDVDVQGVRPRLRTGTSSFSTASLESMSGELVKRVEGSRSVSVSSGASGGGRGMSGKAKVRMGMKRL